MYSCYDARHLYSLASASIEKAVLKVNECEPYLTIPPQTSPACEKKMLGNHELKYSGDSFEVLNHALLRISIESYCKLDEMSIRCFLDNLQ